MALGDVDGDGDLDALIANRAGGADEVWLNDGAGVFTNSGQSLGATDSSNVSLGDVDGDGDLDAHFAGQMWLNNGSGVFSNSGNNVGGGSRDTVLGDLDGDGDLDVFGSATVWLNDPSVGGINITTASPLSNGIVEEPYSVTLEAEGGTPPYLWSITAGSLPPGLTLEPNTGVISGIPTTSGPFDVTVQVTDNSSLTAMKQFALSIQVPPLVIITESPLPGGTVDVPYSAILEAEGGTPPYTWSIASGSLPPGLALGPDTGEISGTPTTAGTFGFTVQVTDSSAIVTTKPFALAPPPSSGTAGSSYTAPISVPDTPPDDGGGTPSCTNYELASGTLPDGLTLDPTTGVISGTPTDGGTYTFTVQCVVSSGPATGQTATKEFTITIDNPVPTITSLNPSSTRAGSGAFILTVNGTDFVESSTVHWNGTGQPTTYVSATQLTAQISAADIATEGTASITVVNPSPNGGTSNSLTFTILPPNQPPVVDTGGPYSVDERGSIQLDASGSTDPNQDANTLTYEWDFDGDNQFDDATGLNPTLSAAGLDGPGSMTVALRVTDDGGLTDIATAEVMVNNVAPTVDAGPDQTVFRNDLVTVSGTWTDPAGTLDNPYAWTWALVGDGNISAGSAVYGDTAAASTSFATEGMYTLTFQVTDKDSGPGSDNLVVEVQNRSPVCSNASPSIDILWPPDHKFVAIEVLGVTDPEGDAPVITIDNIFQDEALDVPGSGNTGPDGQGVGTSNAEVRAERVGGGNGRVYHIGFTADDGHGGTCSGEVLVGVPHDEKDTPIDDGPLFDSTQP